MASSKQKKTTKHTPVNSVNNDHNPNLYTLSNVVSNPVVGAGKRTGKKKKGY